MIEWLKTALFGRPTPLVAPPSMADFHAAIDLPDGFERIPNSIQEPARDLYEPPRVTAFETSDKAVHVRLKTTHDHDGLELYLSDAKKAFELEGTEVLYKSFLEKDGYSMGCAQKDSRSVHVRVREYPMQRKKSVIVECVLTFEDAKDPRAVDLIKTLPDRLRLAPCG